LADLLSEEELAVFRNLVGPNGWCRHYDTEGRSCQIYDDRPSFCRVKTWLATKADGFGVNASDQAELDGFCADCCREHVSSVYGDTSEEMVRFDTAVPFHGVERDGMVRLEAVDGIPSGWEAEEEWGPDIEEDDTEGSDDEDGTDEWEEAEEWSDQLEEEDETDDEDRM